MSSASSDSSSFPLGDTDRTARARIRDAAMHLIGERGFRAATVRGIAERAGVSAALVVHHFGSKDGLREALDDHLASQIRADMFAAMSGGARQDQRKMHDYPRSFAPAMAYLARALTEDAEVGRRLYDRLFADAMDYLQAGEEAGLITRSEDPRARAAALLNADLGQTLLQHHARRVLRADDAVDALVQLSGQMLDLYTDGLFTDETIRDNWSTPHTQEKAP